MRCPGPKLRAIVAAAGCLIWCTLIMAGCSNGANTASGGLADSDAADSDPAVDSGTTLEPTPTAVPVDPEPTPDGPPPLVVVTLMGETNVMAPLDRPAVAGVAAQIDRINVQGGLLGQRIELRRIDTESRVSIAERFTERLLRDPPDLLIVSCDVEFSAPILQLADREGWLTISPCADDVGYATGAWGTRNFSFGAPAEPRGSIAAEIAISRYGPTAMVLRDVSAPEPLRFCDGFERSFRELGGTVSYRDEFRYDTLAPLLDRLAESGPQTSSIVMCSHVPGGNDGAPNIITQLRLGGFGAPIVSGVSVDEVTWFATVPTLEDLTYLSWSSVFGNDPNAAVNELIDHARADTDTPSPGATTVLGADAVDAWARAIAAVRTSDPSAVSAAMASFSNESFLTGDISFLAGGRMDLSRTYRVVRVRGGEVDLPELVTIDS